MRILHISPCYSPVQGGAELHIKELSEGLAARGHHVTVLTANTVNLWDLEEGKFGGLPTVEIINGVKIVRFRPDGGLWGKGLEAWLGLKGGYRSLSRLFTLEGLDLLRQHPRVPAMIPYVLRSDADIVTSINWFWPPAYYAYLARKIKRFTSVGIPLFHTAAPWCHREIYKKLLGACDAVLVNTRHEAEFVLERTAKRVEVAGVGIHPEAFENRVGEEIRARYRLDGTPVVGFVGRQEANKGAIKLLQAMKEVWKWNRKVQLVLAGTRAPRHDEVDAVIGGFTPEEGKRVVRIEGFAEKDKGSLFDAFDVFVLPSIEESFGIAYLEAWLCRKPVIGSRIGSTQCVIDEGVDGLLADPSDPQDIARSIIELLSDREKREKMGDRGFAKTIAHYTWDKVTDKVENLYLDLLTAKRGICPAYLRTKRLSG